MPFALRGVKGRISDAAATTMAAMAKPEDLLKVVVAAVASKVVSICMGDY
jgi:hypothetical protein